MSHLPMSELRVSRDMLLKHAGFIASIGSPGAGKSTFFDTLSDPKWLRLERDRFREAMFGTRRAFWDHPLDVKTKSAVIRRSMKAAMKAWPYPKYMLTDTGTQADAVNYFRETATEQFRKWRSTRPYDPSKRPSILTFLIVFEHPLEVLIERNNTRPKEHRIDEQLLIDKHDETYGPEAWWREIEKRNVIKSRTFIIRPEQIEFAE